MVPLYSGARVDRFWAAISAPRPSLIPACHSCAMLTGPDIFAEDATASRRVAGRAGCDQEQQAVASSDGGVCARVAVGAGVEGAVFRCARQLRCKVSAVTGRAVPGCVGRTYLALDQRAGRGWDNCQE